MYPQRKDIVLHNKVNEKLLDLLKDSINESSAKAYIDIDVSSMVPTKRSLDVHSNFTHSTN